MEEDKPASVVRSANHNGDVCHASSTEDGIESVAEQAERYLLVRNFEKAIEISKVALIDLDHEEFDSNSAVRLAFVLGQAKFELNDLEDAAKLLRRIYGSFLSIPGQVVTLWLILMIETATKETVVAFAEGFTKLYKNKIGGLDRGKFALIYVTKVLCKLCADPEEAEEWTDTHISGSEFKTLKDILVLRIQAYREDQKVVEDTAGDCEVSVEEREDTKVRGAASSKDLEVSSLTEDWKDLLSPQLLFATVIGGTIACALLVEMRGLFIKRYQKK